MSYLLWHFQEDFQAWWHSWQTWKSSFHLFHHIASNRAIFGSFNCYREYYTSTSCRSESSKYSCLFFSSYVQPCISYQEARTALPKLVSRNMLNWSPKWIFRWALLTAECCWLLSSVGCWVLLTAKFCWLLSLWQVLYFQEKLVWLELLSYI